MGADRAALLAEVAAHETERDKERAALVRASGRLDRALATGTPDEVQRAALIVCLHGTLRRGAAYRHEAATYRLRCHDLGGRV